MFKSKTHYNGCTFMRFDNKPPYIIIAISVGNWALYYAIFELCEVFGKASFTLNVAVL